MLENIITKIKNENIQKAFVLAYFYNKVCVGCYKNETIEFHENVNYDLLTGIRIFNENVEIRFVLDDENKEFIETVIRDENNTDYFDEFMITRKGILPFVDSDKELRLVVRNYFEEENNNHQIVLSKSRLLGFTETEGGEYIGIQ